MSGKLESQQSKDENQNDAGADFEKAISISGYGLFQYQLLLLGIPAMLSTTFATTTIAYILPVAECDLQLSLLNKGTLNAITFAGMICSSIVWGYLADTQGRRKILMIGYFGDTVFSLLCSISQNFSSLIVFKFFQGVLINSPSTIFTTYISEFHDAESRPRLFMIIGVMVSMAALVLPFLGLIILPQNWEFILIENFYIHSWQVFLAFSSLPSIICAIALLYLPESPKYLMSHGRNIEALTTFQRIYATNTKKLPSSYPIQQLLQEAPQINDVQSRNSTAKDCQQSLSLKVSLISGWKQMKPMFQQPILCRSLHVYLLQFLIMLGMNSIRLWLPELFSSVSFDIPNYGDLKEHQSTDLCTALELSANHSVANTNIPLSTCIMNRDIKTDMFISNIIISAVGMVGYCLATILIKYLGARNIQIYGLLISACLSLGLYTSKNSWTTLILSALFMTASSLAISSLLSTVIGIFPTTLRALIYALSLMFGRSGGLTGNMLFPIFITMGCLPPFLMVSIALFLAAAMSILIPKPSNNYTT